jgi:hypothetical protein
MTASSATLVELPAQAAPRSGARLIFSVLRAQHRPALFGVLAGVAWSVAKLTAPALVRRGIDRGIRAGEPRQLALAVGGLLLVGGSR